MVPVGTVWPKVMSDFPFVFMSIMTFAGGVNMPLVIRSRARASAGGRGKLPPRLVARSHGCDDRPHLRSLMRLRFRGLRVASQATSSSSRLQPQPATTRGDYRCARTTSATDPRRDEPRRYREARSANRFARSAQAPSSHPMPWRNPLRETRRPYDVRSCLVRHH